MKRFLSLFLIIILTLSLAPSTHTDAAALKLSKTKVTLEVASTLKISLGKISGNKVSWSSSKKSVATVSKWGTITAKAKGKTTITAKYNNKKYTCVVTVKAKDYSDWVLFQTDDFDFVRDGMLAGEIIYYEEDIYLVSPKYYGTVIEPQLEYLKSLENIGSYSGERDNVLTPDAEFNFEDDTEKTNAEDKKALDETIKAMTRYGFASSEDLETDIGKAYIEFCNSWVSEYELEKFYKISTVWGWPDNKIYLIPGVDNNYILENAPDKFTSGEIYTDGGIRYQYLEKFVHNGESYTENQLYFNREDLIAKGIIE